jgi:hypothetical protein
LLAVRGLQRLIFKKVLCSVPSLRGMMKKKAGRERDGKEKTKWTIFYQ